MREALEPFANAWTAFGDKPPDDTTINNNRGAAYLEGTKITFGDLRRAHTALRTLPLQDHARPQVVGRVTGKIYDGDQVPGMPGAICHACGLKDYPCSNPDCPNPAILAEQQTEQNTAGFECGERGTTANPADELRPPAPEQGEGK